MKRTYALILIGPWLLLLLIVGLQIDTPLAWQQQWRLISLNTEAESFADFQFLYAQLPRALMALLVGACLGLAGSLMQQLTQNPLTSPLTLGTSSGSWLALVITTVWFPSLLADYGIWITLSGGVLAFLLVIAITGLNNMTGLPLVVSGMVINILLGAFASAIILLNEEFAQNVFIWGAGDLAQNDWENLQWLAPRVAIVIAPLLLLAPRLLTLLRLGHQGAEARGLAVIPTFFLLMLAACWLVSSVITLVGVIGFIGLITPNMARAAGARTPRQELLLSLLLGAALLLLTDYLSIGLSLWTQEMIPSGVTAAIIGAPALIWFSRRQLKAQDAMTLDLPHGSNQIGKKNRLLLAVLLIGGCLLYLGFQPDTFFFGWPSDFQWSLRWPRLLTALSAGLSLAVAGTILQRLIYNPLASPDILGVSSGATFALIVFALFAGTSQADSAPLLSQSTIAFGGSLAVLVLLLLLGKRHQYAPSSLILCGIALTALMEALVQFSLARGTADSYQLLLWMTGSTYRVTPDQAVTLSTSVIMLALAALLTSRQLTLLAVGRSFALARGLSTQRATVMLLGLVALLCALVTANMGPVTFVGLIAPHMAMMLGAKRVDSQIVVSGVIGSTLMLWSDWLGQVLLYPTQIAAGTLVAILGGLYFLLLMIRSRQA